jgi:hypothetical protein
MLLNNHYSKRFQTKGVCIEKDEKISSYKRKRCSENKVLFLFMSVIIIKNFSYKTFNKMACTKCSVRNLR